MKSVKVKIVGTYSKVVEFEVDNDELVDDKVERYLRTETELFEDSDLDVVSWEC